jgi:hypothetical protein
MATLRPISLNTGEWISAPKLQSYLFLFLFFGEKSLTWKWILGYIYVWNQN